MSILNVKSRTWFDNLPTEIILTIFDYLSNNDIIYTFFYFNQRLNYLLLQNQRYFNYLDLPTTNLDHWTNILSIIGSHVECLNINTTDLSFSLIYFQNLKSIILSSPFGFPDEQLKLILDNNQFNHLHSFKIKENRILSKLLYHNYLSNQDYLLEKIFNNNNSLKIFQYSLVTTPFEHIDFRYFQTNINLHSLTLILTDFEDIFMLINYTPNLTYLNIQSNLPYKNKKSIKKINIKLEQLYLKFHDEDLPISSMFDENINFDLISNVIKIFSSSLICLSLNLVDLITKNTDEILFSSIKLEQLLESMIELKQFFLYAKLSDSRISDNIVLSRFKDQFWFDHNWSFGMNDKYFYTLPFHFEYIFNFYQGFQNVNSNNPEILENNPQIWYNVKSIDLSKEILCDVNFVRQLKIKMPKLTFINFNSHYDYNKDTIENVYKNKFEKEKLNIILDNVKMINCSWDFIENEKEWLIHTLPNLTHLILSQTKISLIDNQYTTIFNNESQQFNIDKSSKVELSTEINHISFFNIKHVSFYLNDSSKRYEWYADIVIKILKYFKNLKILIIYSSQAYSNDRNFVKTVLSELISHLDKNQIMKDYQAKHFQRHSLYSKKLLFI